MLGIIIGVSTVIAVFAIGQGAQQAVDEQFEGLSAKSILIMNMRGRGATGSSKLDTADAKVILEQAEHVAEATALIRGSKTVSYGTESSNLDITGVDESYFAISNLDLDQGRLFTLQDISTQAKIAILGSGVAASIFEEGKNIIGETITVGGKKLEIVGAIEETGRNMGPTSLDDAVMVPLSTAKKSILGRDSFIMISTQADSVENVELATEEITTVLREEHNLRASDEDDFRIFDAGSMVGAAQDAARLMSLLLTAIAAITLLVSGIGIMNVMFVTVAERTKEIGIAKAIGGKRGDILSQFLLESVVLSMIGGIIGVIIGNGVIFIFRNTELISLAPSVMGIIIGFSFSVLVGIFFGFYPALKASRLDPVDALRSE